MTASPPPPENPSRRPIGFDELVAIFVAFLSMGAIFFWAIGRGNTGLDLSQYAVPLVSGRSPLNLPERSPAALPPSALVAPSAAPSPSYEDRISGGIIEGEVRDPSKPDPTSNPAIFGFGIPQTTTENQTGETQSDVAASPEQAIEFSDVPNNYWAYPFITALSQRGIIRGFEDGTFRPEQPVTRAEFASMLEAAFAENPDQRSPINFTDVPASFWAVQEIGKAYSTGFMQGYPGGVFRPEQQIPKFQALIALGRGLNLNSSNSPTQVLQQFQDANQIPDYATDRIAAATESGLVVAYPDSNQLEPNREATRAEVAALIYQAMTQAGLVDRIDSPYIVRP